MQITKKLLKAQVEVQRNVANGKDIEINKQRHKALKDILDFVLSLRYVDDPKLREKVKLFLTSEGKNHVKVNNIAIKYNCTPRSVQILLETTSAKAEESIGKNTIDLIMQGDIETAMLNFKACSTSRVDASKMFVKGIDRLLPSAEKSENLKAGECLQELFLLRLVSTENLRREFDAIDKSKMSFLLYLLSNTDSKYLNEKKVIVDFLNGCISIDKVVELLPR